MTTYLDYVVMAKGDWPNAPGRVWSPPIMSHVLTGRAAVLSVPRLLHIASSDFLKMLREQEDKSLGLSPLIFANLAAANY